VNSIDTNGSLTCLTVTDNKLHADQTYRNHRVDRLAHRFVMVL
jgi:hypothetical protein